MEFALILPILLVCVLGLIEFARAIWTQATLDYAVQAAARCGAVDSNTCGTDVNIQNYAAGKAPGLSFADPTATFTVKRGALAVCNGVQVTASLPFDLLLPALLPNLPTLELLTASACFPT
ncbi:MAG: TadE/TadG family type IV pilus assembly protein [Stellaceae bacterium]